MTKAQTHCYTALSLLAVLYVSGGFAGPERPKSGSATTTSSDLREPHRDLSTGAQVTTDLFALPPTSDG